MESHGDVWFAASGKLATSSAANGNLPVRGGAGRHWNDKGALRMNLCVRLLRGLRLSGWVLGGMLVLASVASVATVDFAVAQTAGPYGAGLVGDRTGDIGVSLLAASGVLLIGAALALAQRPLRTTD